MPRTIKMYPKNHIAMRFLHNRVALTGVDGWLGAAYTPPPTERMLTLDKSAKEKTKTMKTIITRMGYAMLILVGLGACNQIPAGTNPAFYPGEVYQSTPVPEIDISYDVQTLAGGDLYLS